MGAKEVRGKSEKPGFSALESGQSLGNFKLEIFLSLCFPFQGCDALRLTGDDSGHFCSWAQDRRLVGTVPLSVEEVKR